MKQPTRQMLQAQLDQALARGEALEEERDDHYATGLVLSDELRASEKKLAAANALLVKWLETADEQELHASAYESTKAHLGMFDARRPA